MRVVDSKNWDRTKVVVHEGQAAAWESVAAGDEKDLA